MPSRFPPMASTGSSSVTDLGSARVPDFGPLVGAYLARQDWAQTALGSFGESNLPAEVIDVEVLRTEHPGMASVIVACRDCTFHLVLGWRAVAVAPGVLGAQSDAVLGPSRDSSGDVLVYAALADSELVVDLLEAVTAGAEHARRGRVVQSLVSHSSLVYDDRLFMKCYRVIEPRPRPEVEMVRRLDAAGFNHMLAPVGHWHRNGRDLALVREFVPGAVEGLALAHTSLRDLLARADSSENGATFADVGIAGGDLGPEMRRLGETTARMHLALAAAFGTEVRKDSGPPSAVVAGAVRLHGDYHLRRVMRTDGGWLVAGFGDDPLMGAAAGAASQGEGRFASPLEDVADLCCSLQIAADEAVAWQTRSTRAHARLLAKGWQDHNVAAFLSGYLATSGIETLVPGSRREVEVAVAELLAARAAPPP
jgi:maltokinase